MPRTPRRVEERIALRLPPDLARRLRDIAEFEKRSINRQVEQFVEEGVRRWEQAHPEAEQAQGNDRPPG
jgi:hypothetical protein